MLTTKLAHTSARRSALWSLRSAHLANSQLTNTDSVANCHGEADRPTAAAPAPPDPQLQLNKTIYNVSF
jgi:hypothetical protein